MTKDRGGWTMFLLGIPEDRGLRYVGAVRFGVTRRLVADLLDPCPALLRTTPPFADYGERGAQSARFRIIPDPSYHEFYAVTVYSSRAGGGVQGFRERQGIEEPALAPHQPR